MLMFQGFRSNTMNSADLDFNTSNAGVVIKKFQCMNFTIY